MAGLDHQNNAHWNTNTKSSLSSVKLEIIVLFPPHVVWIFVLYSSAWRTCYLFKVLPPKKGAKCRDKCCRTFSSFYFNVFLPFKHWEDSINLKARPVYLIFQRYTLLKAFRLGLYLYYLCVFFFFQQTSLIMVSHCSCSEHVPEDPHFFQICSISVFLFCCYLCSFVTKIYIFFITGHKLRMFFKIQVFNWVMSNMRMSLIQK